MRKKQKTPATNRLLKLFIPLVAAGQYTITQRTHFSGGSNLQQAQLVSITSKSSGISVWVWVVAGVVLCGLAATGLYFVRKLAAKHNGDGPDATRRRSDEYADPDIGGVAPPPPPRDLHERPVRETHWPWW